MEKSGAKEFQQDFKVYKAIMCQYHAFGRCQKGGNCTFAHSKEELRTFPDMRKHKLCAQWLKGRCTYSDDICVYAHGVQQILQAKEKAVSKPALCAAFYSYGTCERGSTCTFAHSTSEIDTAFHSGNESQTGGLKTRTAPSYSKISTNYYKALGMDHRPVSALPVDAHNKKQQTGESATKFTDTAGTACLARKGWEPTNGPLPPPKLKQLAAVEFTVMSVTHELKHTQKKPVLNESKEKGGKRCLHGKVSSRSSHVPTDVSTTTGSPVISPLSVSIAQQTMPAEQHISSKQQVGSKVCVSSEISRNEDSTGANQFDQADTLSKNISIWWNYHQLLHGLRLGASSDELNRLLFSTLPKEYLD